MKITVEFDENGDEEEGEMKKPLTPMQKKVAKMLAQMAGRKKPNEKDKYRASEIDEEDED